MSQKWEYLTVTLARNEKGYTSIAMLDGNSERGTTVGHNAFDVMKQLGEAGWELVTSYTHPGDGRPNLVFKRAGQEG